MDCRASNWKALSICKAREILVTKKPYKVHKYDPSMKNEAMQRYTICGLSFEHC